MPAGSPSIDVAPTPDAVTGRISSASRHDDVSDTSARPTWTCRASSVTNTAAPMIGVDEERARRVPRDAVLEDAEGDRGDRDRRQIAELPDHERGDGRHERGRADRRSPRHAEDACPQEQGDEREQAGDDPRQRRQPADRDAEHRGPVGSLGGRPDRDAESRAVEEDRRRPPSPVERRRGRSGRWRRARTCRS